MNDGHAPSEAAASTAEGQRSESAADERPQATSIGMLFVGLLLAMFMFSLNQTVLATGLPTIVGELHGVGQMLWVMTGFMLAATITMPMYGVLGDQFGRKGLFIFAICMFMVGSAFGMLAQNMALLITGRVFQGIGGGGMMILSQAIIASVVPARDRGKYMGALGGAFAVSSVAGPLIGGWLTEGPGWRWAFAINFPLGIFCILAVLRYLKVPHHATGSTKVDVPGMSLLAIGTTAIVLTSAWGGHDYAWGSPVIIGLIVAAVLSTVAFVVVERRSSTPVIPMWLFAERTFLLSTLAGVAIGVGMFGVLAYMPTYLQMVHGHNATIAGLMMTPMMGTMLVSSIIAGQRVSATGRYKIYPLIGLASAAVALVLLSTLTVDTPVWITLVYLALLGLGLGLTMQMLVLVVQNAFSIKHVGTATASNNYFRQVGGTLGMSLVGTLFTSRLMSSLSSGAGQMPAGAAGGEGGRNSLTPDAIAHMPPQIHDFVVSSYNDALVPLFLWLAPLPALGLIIFSFVKEVPLATRLESVTPAESESTTDAEGDKPVEAKTVEAKSDQPSAAASDRTGETVTKPADRPTQA